MIRRREDLTNLRNIGKTVAQRLNEIGIYSKADLVKLGAPEVYRRLVSRSGKTSLPVCYYLYSIQGALDGVHWDAVEEAIKQDLLRAVGRNKS